MTENVAKKRAVPFSDAPARGWQPWGALAPSARHPLRPHSGAGNAAAPGNDGAGGWWRRSDRDGGPGRLPLLPFASPARSCSAGSASSSGGPWRRSDCRGRAALDMFLLGLAIGAATIFAVVAAELERGRARSAGLGPGLASPAALGGIALLLLAFAVQASAEELLFRGWLLSAVARKFNVTTAVVLSSAVFAFLHFSPGQPLLVTVNVILFALFACCWALKAGNIWGVMGWHAGWNWLLATGFELPVTGLDAHLPALIVKLVPAGPDYLTGGPQGPEGSIFCTGFFLIGTAFPALRRVRRAQSN